MRIPDQNVVDGGPVYPLSYANGTDEPVVDRWGTTLPANAAVFYSGISLRDQIAINVVRTIITECKNDDRPVDSTLAEMFASNAYELADAMLAERLKPRHPR